MVIFLVKDVRVMNKNAEVLLHGMPLIAFPVQKFTLDYPKG